MPGHRRRRHRRHWQRQLGLRGRFDRPGGRGKARDRETRESRPGQVGGGPLRGHDRLRLWDKVGAWPAHSQRLGGVVSAPPHQRHRRRPSRVRGCGAGVATACRRLHACHFYLRRGPAPFYRCALSGARLMPPFVGRGARVLGAWGRARRLLLPPRAG
ncbi:unnamed protein product [Amoebophrya sp. A120]|nr:unnamed protein product [Amoebophrya sp. A120]|eukprot:GSA120T00008954001.1